MPYPLNNVQTADSYNDFVATLELHPPRRAATVIVANAAVYAQLLRVPPGLRGGAAAPEPEELWLPAIVTVDRDFPFAAIRFRSAAPGVPASISARG